MSSTPEAPNPDVPKVSKLAAIKAKLGPKLSGAGKFVGWMKWPLVAGGALIAAAIVGVVILLTTNSPDRYRERAVTEIKKALHAKNVELGALHWAPSFTRLSFGIEASKLRIEEAGAIRFLDASRITLSTEPLKVLFGRFPVKVDIAAEKIILTKTPSATAAEVAESTLKQGKDLPRWTKFLRLEIDVTAEMITVDPALAGTGNDSSIHLQETEVNFLLVGLPGPINVEVESELAVDLKQPPMSAQGPLRFETSGYFQVESGRPIGLKLDHFEFDLSEVTIAGFGSVEKPAEVPLSVDSEVQILLNKDLSFRSAEINKGRFRFDTVAIDFDASFEKAGQTSMRWSLGKRELKNFRLPLAQLRSTPLEGIFETSGQLSIPPEGKFSGLWRIGFNNIKFNPSEVNKGENSAAGKVNLSFMSEGSIEGGRFSSPRTELQIDGTEAEVTLVNGRFRKPIGIPLQVIAKATIVDDRLDFSHFEASFNTSHFEGKAGIDELSAWLEGRPVKVQFNLFSNRIDLSKYVTFFPLFRRPPAVQGFLEFSAAAEGTVESNNVDEQKRSDLQWRVDRFNLSNFQIMLERETLVQFGLNETETAITGPLSASVLFQGRGRGTVVDVASLVAQADLSRAMIAAGERFRKPTNVPLSFDLSAEQTRQSLRVRRGSLRFHDLGLNFAGAIQQGSNRGYIDLRMDKPILLSKWKPFLPSMSSVPVDGRIQWTGRIGFPSMTSMESNFDWKTLSIEGRLEASQLAGRVGDFRNVMQNGRVKLLFAPDALTLESFYAELGDAKIGATGKLGFAGGSRDRRAGNVAKLLARKGLDLSAAMTLNRIDLADFESLPPPGLGKAKAANIDATPPLGDKIRAFLNQPELKDARVSLILRSPKGKIADLEFSDLNSRLLWNDGKLQLQPLALKVFDGQASGSFTLDGQDFYGRGDAPRYNASFKAEALDVADISRIFKPEFAKLLGGRFSGEMTLTSQGFETDDIAKNSRGRMTGKLQNGNFETLRYLQKIVDGFTGNAAVRKFIKQEGGNEACLQEKFTAQVDLQIGQAGVSIQKALVNWATGSSAELNGDLKRDMTVALHGFFFAGPKCISGDVRACLADKSGRAALPFRMEGPAKDAKVGADTDALVNKVAGCLADKAKAVVTQKVQEKVKSEGKKLEKKAKEALEGILKGK